MTECRGWTNCFVRFLRVLLRFVNVGRLRQKVLAKVRSDQFADLVERILRHTRGISTHVRDQAHRSFVTEFHAFIQALRKHHGALHAKTQLARGILLEFAGSEWRGRATAAFLLFYRTHAPLRLAQRASDPLGLFPIRNFGLLAANSGKARVESWRLREVRIDRPVFLLL